MFEVVAMVLAPPEHIAVFAQHYLRCGADKVTVYFDGPAVPPMQEIPGLELVACDDAFWLDAGKERPFFVEDRQIAVYGHHYQRCQADWLLKVDVDELVIGSPNLDAWLAQVPGDAPVVQIRSAEAVYGGDDAIETDFSAHMFRLQFGKFSAPIASRILYGQRAPFFIRGLLGHSIGKQFVRTGLENVELDIHHTSHDGEKIKPLVADGRDLSPPLYLAHFDALSFGRWCEKLDRRLEHDDLRELNQKRKKQRQLYKTARDRGSEHQEALFRKMYGVNRFQKLFLKVAGKLLETNNSSDGGGGQPRRSDLAWRDAIQTRPDVR